MARQESDPVLDPPRAVGAASTPGADGLAFPVGPFFAQYRMGI